MERVQEHEELKKRMMSFLMFLPYPIWKVGTWLSVLLTRHCHIPKHMKRRPVYAHSKAWQRLDDSLVELTDSRLNVILDEQDSAYDWTAQVIKDATIDDLDSDAIMLAREGYKQRYPKFAKECDSWSDKVFLDKACLTIDGKITKATLLLVGKEEKAHKLNHIA